MSAGHVFLVRGDLRWLKCDALAISGDERNEPSEGWGDYLGAEALGPPSSVDGRRVVRRWSQPDQGPVPYVVPDAGAAGEPVEWTTEALRVFLERATRDLGGVPWPKVAVPLLGAGRDSGEVRGELLRATLDTLWAFTAQRAVDVVLVLDSAPAFDAAQAYRRQRGAELWRGLSPERLEQADRLAAKASRGELALFLGAGIGLAAGLPDWNDLLEQIGSRALPEGEYEALRSLSTLDQAQLLTKRIGAEELQRRVVEAIQAHRRPSLSHALLASLPVNEVVTTNYDQLFEQASGAAGVPVHVIPYDGPPQRSRRWLMKLHGCVERPEDIVLSRHTFLRYDASRAALAGAMAGVLITRHVVFVGSSFCDDNVVRIAEEVQRLSMKNGSRRDPSEPRFGTNLAVGVPPVLQELWQGDFDWIDLGNAREGGRNLEIFLDRMAASTSTGASYLFEPRYSGLLTDEDRQLRDALDALLRQVGSLRHPALQAAIALLRERFGWGQPL